MSSELSNHLTTVKNIADTVCGCIGKTFEKKTFLNYEQIHIDNNQRFNSKIVYPPILINNTFNKIQTNVGFLILGDFEITDKTKIEQLKHKLNLETYNNSYFRMSSHKNKLLFYQKYF